MRASLQILVGGAEQLLGQRQHPRVVGLWQAQDGQDDVQWHRHRDVASEVALATQLDHPIDGDARELGHSLLELGEALRQEPLGGDAAQLLVLGAVHMDQRAQQIAVLAPTLVVVGGAQHRPWLVQEDRVLGLDLEDVGVLGDRPEGVESLALDQVHRILAAQQRRRRVEPRPRRRTRTDR